MRPMVRAVAVTGLSMISWGVVPAVAANAVPLDPNAFASLGGFDASAIYTYTFNTGDGTTAPTLTRYLFIDQSTTTLATGVVSNGVAVFDFSSINAAPASFVSVTGGLPLALLSRGSVTLNGGFNVSNGGRGGTAALGSPPVAGGGPGGGTGGQGGAYGGAGGAGTASLDNTQVYGAYNDSFRGGSGGGPGVFAPSTFFTYAAGGAGGGGLQVSALGDITVGALGSVRADGSNGVAQNGYNGGGGGGGGIFFATPGLVTNNGAITADGGDGGTSTAYNVTTNSSSGGASGGGGGGRVLIEAGVGYLSDGFTTGTLTALGGGGFTGTSTGYNGGSGGSVFVTGYTSPAPEPAALGGMAVAAGLLTRRGRRVIG